MRLRMHGGRAYSGAWRADLDNVALIAYDFSGLSYKELINGDYSKREGGWGD